MTKSHGYWLCMVTLAVYGHAQNINGPPVNNFKLLPKPSYKDMHSSTLTETSSIIIQPNLKDHPNLVASAKNISRHCSFAEQLQHIEVAL